jgi:hypothetical protein
LIIVAAFTHAVFEWRDGMQLDFDYGHIDGYKAHNESKYNYHVDYIPTVGFARAKLENKIH